MHALLCSTQPWRMLERRNHLAYAVTMLMSSKINRNSPMNWHCYSEEYLDQSFKQITILHTIIRASARCSMCQNHWVPETRTISSAPVDYPQQRTHAQESRKKWMPLYQPNCPSRMKTQTGCMLVTKWMMYNPCHELNLKAGARSKSRGHPSLKTRCWCATKYIKPL